ncbi:MAG: hypothetical protein AABZ53_03345 [Planctomycetota bacterium]
MTALSNTIDDAALLVGEQTQLLTELLAITRRNQIAMASDAGIADDVLEQRRPLIERAAFVAETLRVLNARSRADLAPGYAHIAELIARLEMLDAETLESLHERRDQIAGELGALTRQARVGVGYADGASGPQFQDKEA